MKRVNRNYTLDITKHIINVSEKNSSTKCVLANAIREQIDHSYGIDVDSNFTKFNLPNDPKLGPAGGGTRYKYRTPMKAGIEAINFDDGEKPEPFKVFLSGRHAEPPKDIVLKGPRAYKARIKSDLNTIISQKPRKTTRRRHGYKVIGYNND